MNNSQIRIKFERESKRLRRGLQNRHVQMIALGGCIGTGLFYGSKEAIHLAGPAVVLAYLFGGFIIYCIMRMLGEMLLEEEPTSGSFSFFAYKYFGHFWGFMTGWNYWFLYVLVGIAELTVLGFYLDHWFVMDHWKSALISACLIALINLVNVRLLGEFEFYVALVKVLAVIGMIVFGIFLIVTGINNNQASVSNIWQYGGFFPHDVIGVVFATVVVMFSFGGTELISVASGETSDPEKTIPKAISKVVWRIIIFYILSLSVIMMISPWNTIGENGSPFVTIFGAVGIPAAGHILNFVVIAALISVYNSCIYSNSRMLYNLAIQKNAPRIFTKLNSVGVPYVASLFSSFCSAIGIVVNFLVPDGRFMRIMAIVTAAALITWIVIVFVHLAFRKAHKGRKDSFIYEFGLYPYANYLCILFFALLFGMMFLSGFGTGGVIAQCFDGIGWDTTFMQSYVPAQMPDMSLAVIIVPIWCLFLICIYQFKRRFS